jgi:hypothetical protein
MRETDLGVHNPGGNICICDMFPELAPQLRFYFFEIKGLHSRAWAAVYSGLIPDNVRAQRLWETSHRLSKIPLEEFDDRCREVQLLGTFNDVFFRELVGCHPLCEVTDNFGRWCNLFANKTPKENKQLTKRHALTIPPH